MTLVRFCATCDVDGCGRRSEEYTAWASCRECCADVCPWHADPASYRCGDGEPMTCLCWPCQAQLEVLDRLAPDAHLGGVGGE